MYSASKKPTCEELELHVLDKTFDCAETLCATALTNDSDNLSETFKTIIIRSCARQILKKKKKNEMHINTRKKTLQLQFVLGV